MVLVYQSPVGSILSAPFRSIIAALCEKDNDDVYQEHYPCDDSPNNLTTGCIGCQLPSKAAIDGSKNEEASSDPNMAQRKACFPLAFSIEVVVKPTTDRLEEQETDDDHANDGMRIRELDDLSGNVLAQ